MHEPGPLAADKVLYIAPGTEVPDIIAELDREGVIDSPFMLNVALLLEGNRSKLKAGEYLFKQNASLRDVIDTLISGKQVLHAITIPEGLTSEQIVERLRNSDILLGDITDMPKEGSLLPETYKVARGDRPGGCHQENAGRSKARRRSDLVAPGERPSLALALRARHLGLDRRKGNRQGGREAAGR